MSASATEESSPVKGDKRVFTDKEEKVLKAAWSCLKAPPEVDIEKLKVAADFNTTKTASNTWGVIKKKLAAMAPPADEGDDNTVTTPNTKSTSKKRGKKAAATDGDGLDENQDFETPTKKRKTRKVVKAGGEGATTTEVIKTEEAEEDAEN